MVLITLRISLSDGVSHELLFVMNQNGSNVLTQSSFQAGMHFYRLPLRSVSLHLTTDNALLAVLSHTS